MQKLLSYLRLMRPANIVTSVADILLGFAASGLVQNPFFSDGHFNISGLDALLWLILSTIGLYGGGVVFNDVFDAELDKVERPERPIPSGIGEIGYDEQTKAEDKYYRLQLELAKELNMPVQIHTPHRNKKTGTTRSMDVCIEHGIDPSLVIVDHNNEETVKEVLDRGFWAAFTIYPHTKMGNERMVEIVKQYGSERISVNSAADWGISDPLAVPKTAALMKERGISENDIRMVCYQNALTAFGKSGQMKEEDWLNAPGIDQTEKYTGNSILRGGQTGRVDPKQGSNVIK